MSLLERVRQICSNLPEQVPANKILFAGTVPANKFLFAGTVPANNLFHKKKEKKIKFNVQIYIFSLTWWKGTKQGYAKIITIRFWPDLKNVNIEDYFRKSSFLLPATRPPFIPRKVPVTTAPVAMDPMMMPVPIVSSKKGLDWMGEGIERQSRKMNTWTFL